MLQNPSDRSAVSTARVDSHRLRQWYSAYVALGEDEALDTSPQVPDFSHASVLADVDSDHIDAVYIEDQIAQAALVTHVSEKFCNRCLHLFSHWPDLEADSWAHANGGPCHTAQIEAAARQGCDFCAFLLTRLTRAGRLFTFYKVEKRLDDLNKNSNTSISIQNVQYGDDEIQQIWLNFPGRTADGNFSWWTAQSGTWVESFMVPPTFYVETHKKPLEIANDWLHTCSKCHDLCVHKGELERPTRLLCIADDAIRLVLTVGWQEMPAYATLSYCWGTNDFLKLTPNTLDELLDVIPPDHLPKTFTDAIYIARKLGLHYIWIDALCIIQNTIDNRDWLRESGIMRSIYGGSHINIAAASATNVQGGCFSKPATFCGGFSARVESDTFSRVLNFHSINVHEKSTNMSHLASRAWAFQERLLAPRTIHFGDRGVFWECWSMLGSEFLPHGFHGMRDTKRVRPQHQAWDWSDIIGLYSGATLTNGTDKLPALSGIARRQYEVNGDEYLAGMWRKRFLYQLGWISVAHGGHTRPAWRAPSWSWTSVDGPVWYVDQTLVTDIFVEVINATTSATGPDPFGPITSAELRLACTVMLRGYYDVVGHVFGASSNAPKREKVTVKVAGYDYIVFMDCSVDNFLRPEEPVFLLPLFGGTLSTSEYLTIRGMVLRRNSLVQGHFQRIGAFEFHTQNDALDSSDEVLRDPEVEPIAYHELLRAIEETGASTAESECGQIRVDAGTSQAKHVIFID